MIYPLIISVAWIVYLALDAIIFFWALHNFSRNGGTWEQWSSIGWTRFLPGGGFYAKRQCRLMLEAMKRREEQS